MATHADRTLDMYLRDVRFGSRREWAGYIRASTALRQIAVAEVEESIRRVRPTVPPGSPENDYADERT